MTCVRCAREIEAESVFCRFCGAPVQAGAPGLRLTRLPAQGQIAGVCAGLAWHFGVDVTLVRLAWVVLSIVPGGIIGGLIAYIVAWMVMPAAHGPYDVRPRRRLYRSTGDVQIAGVCGGIAEYFGVDPTAVRLLWVVLTIVPGAIVMGVLAYLVAWAVIPRGAAPPLQTAPTTP